MAFRFVLFLFAFFFILLFLVPYLIRLFSNNLIFAYADLFNFQLIFLLLYNRCNCKTC